MTKRWKCGWKTAWTWKIPRDSALSHRKCKVTFQAACSIVYLDESGIDNRIHQEYGRSPQGEKLFAEVPRGKKQRVSIISATCQRQIFVPLIFEGSCNTEVFNGWMEKELAPELKPGQTVVMDNASFHKSARTVELIATAGCRVLFLPPYAPDYNPVEHFWHTLKEAV